MPIKSIKFLDSLMHCHTFFCESPDVSFLQPFAVQQVLGKSISTSIMDAWIGNFFSMSSQVC